MTEPVQSLVRWQVGSDQGEELRNRDLVFGIEVHLQGQWRVIPEVPPDDVGRFEEGRDEVRVLAEEGADGVRGRNA